MNKKYTPDQINYLRSIATGSDPESITKKYNKCFKVNYTQVSIQRLMNRNGITTGKHDNYSKPEYIDYLQNIAHGKTIEQMRSIFNAHFNINLELSKIRYMMRKNKIITGYRMEKGKRKEKRHYYTWEETNGKVPENHVLIFLDGNYSNIVLDNILCISKSEFVYMAHNKLFFNDRDLTKTGLMIARHKIAINKVIKRQTEAV
jgi:hypothetical protein